MTRQETAPKIIYRQKMELILRYIELLELCRSEFCDPFFTDMELRCLEEIGELLRYNHNHDPHTGRFTSGDSVNTVDKSVKSDIIKTGSDDVAEIIELGKFDTQPLEIEFGKLKTDELIVTNERIEHIKSRHPEDFNLFEKYSLSVVVEPDFIIKDEKNINTVFMVKKLENTNLNLVVKIILETDEKDLKNSVMTFYRIRERNLKKLVDRNKTLYKSE